MSLSLPVCMPEAIKWGESKRVQASSCMMTTLPPASVCCGLVRGGTRSPASTLGAGSPLPMASSSCIGLGLALLHSNHHQGHSVAARKRQDQLSHVRATANADERQGSSPEPKDIHTTSGSRPEPQAFSCALLVAQAADIKMTLTISGPLTHSWPSLAAWPWVSAWPRVATQAAHISMVPQSSKT